MMDKNQNLEVFLEKRVETITMAGMALIRLWKMTGKMLPRKMDMGKRTADKEKWETTPVNTRNAAVFRPEFTPMIWSRHILTSQRNPFFYLLRKIRIQALGF